MIEVTRAQEHVGEEMVDDRVVLPRDADLYATSTVSVFAGAGCERTATDFGSVPTDAT
ncbi:MAG: hypothetical protein AAGF73_15235 [Actinomycetota bacterium]